MHLSNATIGSVAALAALAASPAQAALVLSNVSDLFVNYDTGASIDLNNDSYVDFNLRLGQGLYFSGANSSVQLLAGGGATNYEFSDNTFVSFGTNGQQTVDLTSDSGAPYTHPADGLFSVFRFTDNTQTSTYMGYIEWGAMSDDSGGYIKSIGYETLADTGITTGAAVPEPSTWGAITAACAAGFGLWRRRRNAAPAS